MACRKFQFLEAAMNIDTKAVHFSLRDDSKEYLEKKLSRLRSAEAHIVDLLVTLDKEPQEFEAEATVNFRWGLSAHIKEKDADLNAAIDKMVDSLVQKVNKEKEKVQEKR
jgi:putative sigma-54 modulation protein